ncbi:MAG: tetratricopeptide repeat protein [Kofleriaceae bacterium]
MSCPSAEQLAGLVEGTNDAATVAHLAACEACTEVVRVLRDAGDAAWPVAEGTRDEIGPAPGDTIGRYVVLRAVAQGGMGEVYLGYDPALDRNVALKLVRADHNGSPTFGARLDREARVLAKLAHPNVVRVFDAGTWRGSGYVAMEYLQGESARQWCRAASRSVHAIVRVFAGAARGLGAAHALGVVHRDVKPDNILVGEDGIGRIADFGLVTDTAGITDRAPVGSSSDGVRSTAAGTDGYRAPEVIAGARADARSDQWSLCAALCEMLAGELPPASGGVPATRRLRRLPPPIARALRLGLDPDPANRFASIDELASALEQRTRSRFVLGGVAVVAFGVAAWLLLQPGRAIDPDAHCISEARTSTTAVEPLRDPAFVRQFDRFGGAAEQRRAAFDRAVTSYTTRLSASALAACRLEPVDPRAAALQRVCLVDRSRELSALVAAIRTTDRAGLEQAPFAFSKLSDPGLCDEPARLATIVPVDPASRAEADLIAGEVAALQSRMLLGDRAELVPLARGLVARAERLGAATTAFAATSLLADLVANAGDLTAAIDGNLTAARHAAIAHDDRAMALRLTRAADIAALAADLSRAGALVGAAAVIVERVDDPAVRDDLESARAELAVQRGQAGDMVPVLRRIVDRARARHGLASAEYHRRMYQLARALRGAGEVDESRELARTGLAEVTANLGADHPASIVYLSHLGRIASETGDLPGARRELERVLALTRVTYGDDSVLVADALGNLAAVLTLQGDHQHAVELGEQALAMYHRHGGTKNLAGHISNLASAYLEVGRTRDGLAMLERVLAIREQQFGSDSAQLLQPLVAIGVAHADAGQRDGARRSWSRAVAIAQGMSTTPPDFMIDTMRELAPLLADPRARARMLRDADALERRHAATSEVTRR